MVYRSVLPILLITSSLLCCVKQTPEQATVATPVDVEPDTTATVLVVSPLSYQNISGVSQEDLETVAGFRARGREFIMGVSDPSLYFTQKDGTISGYAALLCKWLSVVFDLSFTPRFYETNALVAGIENHQIDFSMPQGQGSTTYPVISTGNPALSPITRIAALALEQGGAELLAELRNKEPHEYRFSEPNNIERAHEETPILETPIEETIEPLNMEQELDDRDTIQALLHFLTRYNLIIIIILFATIVLLIIFVLLNTIHYKQLNKHLESTISQRTEQLEIQTKVAQDCAHELEIQTKVAQLAAQTKSNFLVRINHEIRAPLNTIISMIEIARKTNISPKTLVSLDQISTASTHLQALLNDMLDMAKIESGTFALAHELFLLRTTMMEVASIIAPHCRAKQIHFLTNVRELPDISILGDKVRLKQVLIKLLDNSVKFTPKQGKLALVVKTEQETNKDVAIMFRVTDSGIGMNEAQIAKIFSSFESTDTSITTRFDSTSLGLSISQSLIAKMGGQLTVKSNPGKGSSFSFTITCEKTDA
ncbi:MAG: hypothetical protein LBJ41_11490 [Treponema sp.]|jgi:signal transduction histidine kinase|nr:hypothetical protein [Treponema sp.]